MIQINDICATMIMTVSQTLTRCNWLIELWLEGVFGHLTRDLKRFDGIKTIWDQIFTRLRTLKTNLVRLIVFHFLKSSPQELRCNMWSREAPSLAHLVNCWIQPITQSEDPSFISMDVTQMEWPDSNSMDLFDQDFDIGEWSLPPEPVIEQPPPTAQAISEPLANPLKPKRRRPRTILKSTSTIVSQTHKRLKSSVRPYIARLGAYHLNNVAV